MTNTPNLKTLRKALGLSVNQLADWLDVNERTIRRWEYGEMGTPKSVLMCCAYRLEGKDSTNKELVDIATELLHTLEVFEDSMLGRFVEPEVDAKVEKAIAKAKGQL